MRQLQRASLNSNNILLIIFSFSFFQTNHILFFFLFFLGVAAPRLTTGWCQRARLGVAAVATAADAPRKGAFRSLATSRSALPGVFKPVAGQPLADVPRLSHRGLEVNRRLPTYLPTLACERSLSDFSFPAPACPQVGCEGFSLTRYIV